MANWKKLVAYNSGDTITVSNPSADTHAVNKAYVDSAVSGENLWNRASTTLSPNTSGDNLDNLGTISSGPITSSGLITGVGITTTGAITATGQTIGSGAITSTGTVAGVAGTFSGAVTGASYTGGAISGTTGAFSDDVTLSSTSPQLHLTNTGTSASQWVSFNTSSGRTGFVGQGGTGTQIVLQAGSGNELLLKSGGADAVTFNASQNATFTGTIGSGNITSTGTVSAEQLTSTDDLTVAGLATIGETLAVTGVATFTAQSVHNGGMSTGALVLNDGSITDTSGAISFGDENLTTTGTVKSTSFGVGVTPSTTYPFEYAGSARFVSKYISSNGDGTHGWYGNTGSGTAGIYMDASNGDLSGSDYAWILQKNDLSLSIQTASSAGNIVLTSKDSTSLTLDGANATVSGNLVVGGDLTISGDTTTVNTATITVEDPLIKLASGNSSSDIVDIGFYGLCDPTGSQDTYTGLVRDASDGRYHLFDLLQVEPTTTMNISGAGFDHADLTVGAMTVDDNLTVTGDITVSANSLTIGSTVMSESSGAINFTGGVIATTGAFSGAVTGASYSGGTVSGTTATFSTQLILPNGIAGTPAIRFADGDSGVYASANGEVAISTNGSERLKITNTLSTFATDLKISDDLYFNSVSGWLIASGTGGTLRVQTFDELEVDGILDINGTGTSTFAGGITQAWNQEHKWEVHGSQSASRAWGFKNDAASYGDFALVSSNARDNTLDTTVMSFDNSQNATFSGSIKAAGAGFYAYNNSTHFLVMRATLSNKSEIMYDDADTFSIGTAAEFDGTSYSAKLLIDSSGNVGIGTSPSYRLDVLDDVTPQINISNTVSDNTAKFAHITVSHYHNSEEPMTMIEGRSDGSNNYLRLGGGRSEGNSMQILEGYFGTNDATVAGVKKWHFDEDDGYFLQNVGIGASPTEKLSVISSTAATRGILELKNTGDNHTFIVSDSNLSGAGSGMGGLRGFWNGNEVSRISFETGTDTTNKDDGKIALYTRTSGSALALALTLNTDQSATFAGNITQTSASDIDFVMDGTGTNHIDLAIRNGSGNNRIDFCTDKSFSSGTRFLVVDSSQNSTFYGDVGIEGDATLYSALQVNGNTTLGNASSDVLTVNGRIVSSASSTTPVEFESTGANDNYFNFRKTTDGGGNARINIIGRREAANSDCAGVYFLNKYSGTDREISRIIANTTDSNGVSGYLRFQTSNGGTLADRLTINHDGSATFAGTVTSNGVTLTGDQTLPTDFVSAANGGTFAGKVLISKDLGDTSGALSTMASHHLVLATGSGTNDTAGIGFYASGDEYIGAAIQFKRIGNAGTGDLTFYVKDDGNESSGDEPTAVLTMNDDGNSIFTGNVVIDDVSEGGKGFSIHNQYPVSSDARAATFRGTEEGYGYHTDIVSQGYKGGSYSSDIRFYTHDHAVTANATLALTIDKSHNATFTGNVTADGFYSDYLELNGQYFASHSGNTFRIGSTNDQNISLYAGASNVLLLDGGDQSATFTGNVAIGTTPATTGALLNLDHTSTDWIRFYDDSCAHGMTDIAPTNCSGMLEQASGNDGGVVLRGLGDGKEGVYVIGIPSTEDTTSASTSQAAVIVQGQTNNGTTTQAMSAGANLFAVQSPNTKFIIKGNGDIVQVAGASSWAGNATFAGNATTFGDGTTNTFCYIDSGNSNSGYIRFRDATDDIRCSIQADLQGDNNAYGDISFMTGGNVLALNLSRDQNAEFAGNVTADGFYSDYLELNGQYFASHSGNTFRIGSTNDHNISLYAGASNVLLLDGGDQSATFAGKVDLTNATSWEPQLRIFSTHTGTTPGQLQFWKKPSDNSMADGDMLGQVGWAGLNSANADQWYVQMIAKALDVTDGSEDGGLYIQQTIAGTEDVEVFKIEAGTTTFKADVHISGTDNRLAMWNTNNGDYATIHGWQSGGVAGIAFNTDSVANAVVIQNDGKVGIGETVPASTLHLKDNSNYTLKVEKTGTNVHMAHFKSNGAAALGIAVDHANDLVRFNSEGSGDSMVFEVNDGTDVLTLNSSANATFAGNVTVAGKSALGGTFVDYPVNMYGSNEVLAIRSSHQYNGALSLRVNATASTGGTNVLYIATKASMAGSGTDDHPQILAQGSRSLGLGFNTTEVLTLDSSSNATFAGSLTIGASKEFRTSGQYGTKTFSGYTTGHASLAISVGTTLSQATMEITCAFTHYGAAFSSYGCARSGVINCYNGSIAEVNAYNVTSSNGGAWTYSLSGQALTVNKSAGSYAGGGYYIIKINGGWDD